VVKEIVLLENVEYSEAMLVCSSSSGRRFMELEEGIEKVPRTVRMKTEKKRGK
jgi:hypothetical protein